MGYKYYPINLGQANITDAYNTRFQYNLMGTTATFKDADIALTKVNIYNSIFNINSSLYNNNTFSIIFPCGTSGIAPQTTYTLNIVLPNSNMAYEDINYFVEQAMITAGLYLINGSNNVYFWSIQSNPTTYSCQINEFSVNNTGSYTLPPTGVYSAGGAGLPPTNNYTPQTVISNNGFTTIVGLNPATYPATPQTATYSITSTFTPEINPVQSLNVHCSLVNSPYSNPPDYVDNIDPNQVQYGALLSYMPPQLNWITVPNQTISALVVYFTDQNNNPVQIPDPSTRISLTIRTNYE